MHYKVTCFFKESPDRLFQILERKSFHRTLDNTMKWSHRNSVLEVVPFSSPGRETNGYRFYFEGNSEVFQFLLNNLAGSVDPTITGIESTISTKLTQAQLINLAKRTSYRKCSMPGLYEHEGVGIVMLKSGEVNFQIRNRLFTIGRLHQTIGMINRIASPLMNDVPAAEARNRKGRALA